MACWLVYNVRISYILINISLAPSFSAPFPKQYSIKPACCLAHSAPGGLITRTWVGTLRGSSPRRAAPDTPRPIPGLGGSLPCAACQRGPDRIPLASPLPAQRGAGGASCPRCPRGAPGSSPVRPSRRGGRGSGGSSHCWSGLCLPVLSAHMATRAAPALLQLLETLLRQGLAEQNSTRPRCLHFICAPLGPGREKQRSSSSTKQVIRLHTANLL